MNYRHAYHAGNFADVVKHIVLSRLVEYLKQKDKAFRVIDTHAGAGVYDLASTEAGKTGEWRSGIAKLMASQGDEGTANLLTPYLDAVRAVNPGGGLKKYPGSPMVVRHLLRSQDRLSAIELHPQDARRLKSVFEGDFQTRVIKLDGWLALGAHLPPKEKRGLVLVDPPFEEEGEFGRLTEGLRKAYQRWPGGTYALWYPIKDRVAVAAFRRGLRQLGFAKVLDIAFEVRLASNEPRLDGTGMIVVNPPFTLAGELQSLFPALHGLLAVDQVAPWSVASLSQDKQGA